MISVCIVGATGYTGAELMRLLSHHPEFQLTMATSRSDAGKAVADFWPALRGQVDLAFSAPEVEEMANADMVFFATPNGTAMTQTPALIERGCKVVDLSADFRLQDLSSWSKWYGQQHACPALVADAAYGLPELFRDEIATAKIVANPGCYPTAVVLGLLPLLEQKLIDPKSIIADTKSGVSGAGRGADVGKLFGEVSEDFKSYAIGGHRHHPEIVQSLNQVSAAPVGFTFVPHLLPMFRGMQATIYASLTSSVEEFQGIYADRYSKHPFVDILPDGSCPQTASVKGSNYCRIAVQPDRENNRVIVLSVIDNLVKGAAGQAIQNANLMCGLEETAGLAGVGLFP